MPPEYNYHREGGSQVYQISSALWNTLLDPLPVPLFLVDNQDQVTFLNPALIRLLIPGLEKQKSKPLIEILSILAELTPDPGRVVEQLKELFSAQETSRLKDIDFDTPAGGKYHFVYFTGPQLVPGLEIRGGLLQDVTDPWKEKRAGNKMVSAMLTNIRAGGAELGGKLGAVKQNLDIWPDSMQEQFLAASEQNLQAMLEDLDLLLLYNRLREEGNWLFSEPYSLSDLMRGIENRIDQKEQSSISFQYQGPEENQEVMIDPGAGVGTMAAVIARVLPDSESDQELVIFSGKEERFINIQVPIRADQNGPPLEWADLQKENPYLVILKRTLKVQGGNLEYLSRKDRKTFRSYLEIILPIVRARPVPEIPKTQKSLHGQGRRIIIASAKADQLGLLTETFQDRGFRISSAASAAALLDMTQLFGPDLILLDRDLPPLDGVQALTSLRRWSRIPVIVLSGRSDPQDSIRLFEAGADDYVRIPYLNDELAARADVILDRIHRSRTSSENALLEFQGLRINLNTRQVWARGKSLDLTPLEFNILAYLAQRPGQVITYEQILNQAWDGPEKGSRQGLFVHLSRLRDKLEENPDAPVWIRNHWGVGYEFGRIEKGDI